MSRMQAPAYMAAPGRERPDYTAFTFPAAGLADGGAEEIEIDQALSLAGRFGRDFLGCQFSGVLNDFIAEHLTIGTADHDMLLILTLASRTGAFGFQDPELIWLWEIGQAVTAPTTATSQALSLIDSGLMLGEPELYVAPRLFFRTSNEIDATIAADAMSCRIASVSRRLTFELFIELLERFADVTLL